MHTYIYYVILSAVKAQLPESWANFGSSACHVGDLGDGKVCKESLQGLGLGFRVQDLERSGVQRAEDRSNRESCTFFCLMLWRPRT